MAPQVQFAPLPGGRIFSWSTIPSPWRGPSHSRDRGLVTAWRLAPPATVEVAGGDSNPPPTPPSPLVHILTCPVPVAWQVSFLSISSESSSAPRSTFLIIFLPLVGATGARARARVCSRAWVRAWRLARSSKPCLFLTRRCTDALDRPYHLFLSAQGVPMLSQA